MTAITDTIALNLHIAAHEISLVTAPSGAARIYVPTRIPRDRLAVEFLSAKSDAMSIVSVGADDDGTFVGFEVCKEAG